MLLTALLLDSPKRKSFTLRHRGFFLATIAACLAWSETHSLTAAAFTNSAAIAIPDLGAATPYPSTISISGLAGSVTKVTVALNQLTHTYPDDLDVLLVGPAGQKVLLMSDAGGAAALINVTITLDDAAGSNLPNNTRISSGTYRPSNYAGAGDTFAAPAPAGPYSALLSAFNGTAPNGAWSLYVVDGYALDQGTLNGGWTLTVTTTVDSTSPVITAQPVSQGVPVGSNAIFTVTATGTAPLGCQWRFNGGAIAGASNASLGLTNVQPDDAGSYTVVVTNSLGSVTSAVAVLTVLVPPAITAQPQSLTNVAGTTASFSATADGSTPLSYQWRFNGLALSNGGRISGANTGTLTIANVQPVDAGSYALVVSNAAGAVTSAVAVLSVTGPPVITLQPASQNAAVGGGCKVQCYRLRNCAAGFPVAFQRRRPRRRQPVQRC